MHSEVQLRSPTPLALLPISTSIATTLFHSSPAHFIPSPPHHHISRRQQSLVLLRMAWPTRSARSGGCGKRIAIDVQFVAVTLHNYLYAPAHALPSLRPWLVLALSLHAKSTWKTWKGTTCSVKKPTRASSYTSSSATIWPFGMSSRSFRCPLAPAIPCACASSDVCSVHLWSCDPSSGGSTVCSSQRHKRLPCSQKTRRSLGTSAAVSRRVVLVAHSHLHQARQRQVGRR